MTPRSDPPPPLPSVAGTLSTSFAEFEHRCLVQISALQAEPNFDAALLALLCDAVRVVREVKPPMLEVSDPPPPRDETPQIMDAATVARISAQVTSAEPYYLPALLASHEALRRLLRETLGCDCRVDETCFVCDPPSPEDLPTIEQVSGCLSGEQVDAPAPPPDPPAREEPFVGRCMWCGVVAYDCTHEDVKAHIERCHAHPFAVEKSRANQLEAEVTRLTAEKASWIESARQSAEQRTAAERERDEARRERDALEAERNQLAAEHKGITRDLDYARRWRSRIADQLNVPLPQAEGRVWQAIESALDELAALRRHHERR